MFKSAVMVGRATPITPVSSDAKLKSARYAELQASICMTPTSEEEASNTGDDGEVDDISCELRRFFKGSEFLLFVRACEAATLFEMREFRLLKLALYRVCFFDIVVYVGCRHGAELEANKG